MKTGSRFRRGFTLVEMLVSIAIMGIMLTAMAQISGLTERAWRVEQDRIDNFSKARSMLNLLTNDLQRAIFRGDLPAFGTGAPAPSPTLSNTGLYYFTTTTFAAAFYTRQAGLPANGSTPVRNISLVSYSLQVVAQGSSNASDKIVLQRSDLDVPWTGNGSISNVAFQGDMSPLLSSAIAQEVAPGVVGFGLAFRRADGTMIAPQDPSGGAGEQYTGYNLANPVIAVDVCLAVIGKQTLEKLSTSQLQAIQTKLAGDLTAANLITVTNQSNQVVSSKSVKAIWDQLSLPSFFNKPSISYPKDLGSGLKTFECWVPCQPF